MQTQFYWAYFILLQKKPLEFSNKNIRHANIHSKARGHEKTTVVNVARVNVIKNTVWQTKTFPTISTQLSVDGENVTLDLMAQLGLEVAELLLEHRQRRHDNGFWSQGATRLHIVIEPARTHACIVGLVDASFAFHMDARYKPHHICCGKLKK